MEYFSFRKPWNGYSTTVVNVDTHERKEWTDTEDAASVKINQAPYFQNRTASNPNLSHQGADSEPFNYIAFSSFLLTFSEYNVWIELKILSINLIIQFIT